MKVAFLHEYGPPSKLKYEDFPSAGGILATEHSMEAVTAED
jgi:hypothetical protein